ncbi:uncharacterized protein LOC143884534 [Tasmannia lanceolata]|uniref:uncharacterized protein LOC143884534 n=1 Tax=Tasmannia lanceolata TaxID=3420 RepID=UPI0040632112
MGSACCVAARDKTIPSRAVIQSSSRNVRYSPSWSIQWDSRAHIEERLDNHVRFSVDNSGRHGSEIKGGLEAETESFSDGGSPMENFRTPTWQKSPVCEGAAGNSRASALDLSSGSNLTAEEKGLAKPSTVMIASDSKCLVSVPSNSSSSMPKADSSSSQSHMLPSDPTPSRRARRSPGYQLSSNDFTMGSHGGSSDGWSMRTFSELVASQRERWSFDGENMSSSHCKITRSNSRILVSPSTDLQTCGICSKLLTERSSWSSQKIIASNELSVVAVLVCGHVFHAECLEHSTTEIDRYDPSCPVCSIEDKMASKIARKPLKSEVDLKGRNKISRIGVIDSDIDGEAVSGQRNRARREGKGPKMGTSSSMRSSFARPFLRRHFSIGSKSTRPVSENESTRRKGFWARSLKE